MHTRIWRHVLLTDLLPLWQLDSLTGHVNLLFLLFLSMLSVVIRSFSQHRSPDPNISQSRGSWNFILRDLRLDGTCDAHGVEVLSIKSDVVLELLHEDVGLGVDLESVEQFWGEFKFFHEDVLLFETHEVTKFFPVRAEVFDDVFVCMGSYIHIPVNTIKRRLWSYLWAASLRWLFLTWRLPGRFPTLTSFRWKDWSPPPLHLCLIITIIIWIHVTPHKTWRPISQSILHGWNLVKIAYLDLWLLSWKFLKTFLGELKRGSSAWFLDWLGVVRVVNVEDPLLDILLLVV